MTSKPCPGEPGISRVNASFLDENMARKTLSTQSHSEDVTYFNEKKVNLETYGNYTSVDDRWSTAEFDTRERTLATGNNERYFQMQELSNEFGTERTLHAGNDGENVHWQTERTYSNYPERVFSGKSSHLDGNVPSYNGLVYN